MPAPICQPAPPSWRRRPTRWWDLFASYRVNDRIQADFILQNIFDKRYTQYLNALPNPGLVAKAAISIKFATR